MFLEGIATLLMRMSEDESFNNQIKREVVLEVKDEYIKEREEYLKSIDPEYRGIARRDKDMLFESFVALYMNNNTEYTKLNTPYKEVDIKEQKKEMMELVFNADIRMPWMWEEHEPLWNRKEAHE